MILYLQLFEKIMNFSNFNLEPSKKISISNLSMMTNEHVMYIYN